MSIPLQLNAYHSTKEAKETVVPHIYFQALSF